jgi:hypothetical protein
LQKQHKAVKKTVTSKIHNLINQNHYWCRTIIWPLREAWMSFILQVSQNSRSKGRTPVSYSASPGFKPRPGHWIYSAFLYFPWSLPVNTEAVAQIRPRPPPSTFRPIHYYLSSFHSKLYIWATDSAVKQNINIQSKIKISLLQAVEAHRVARGRGSHIT